MNAAIYAETVTTILRRHYGQMKHAAKLLSRAVDTTPRTVENWLDGTNAPRGAELIKLMSECDELSEEIFRLVAERKKAREAKCPGSD